MARDAIIALPLPTKTILNFDFSFESGLTVSAVMWVAEPRIVSTSSRDCCTYGRESDAKPSGLDIFLKQVLP